jgi:hypothetical protein
MEDALSENDSRPLPQNTTLISLPVLKRLLEFTLQRVFFRGRHAEA